MAPKVRLEMEHAAMVYFPGQNINGCVKVESVKKNKCKSLSIRFSGFASVSWRQQKLGGRGRKERTLCAQESYYEGQQQLWADPSYEMGTGKLEFPFTFMLPLNSPASFVGKYGQVVHQMTIKLETVKGKDIILVQPFSVNSVVDLNLDRNSKEPQQRQKTHTLGCWHCRSGPLSVAVRLDKSGYAPGEPIVINAELKNMTKITISGTTAKLIMGTTYKAMGKEKLQQQTLTKINKGEIAKGMEGVWQNEALVIPPLPPSPLPGCNIIDISYQLQFSASFKGISSNLKILFPIYLGTIPTVDSSPSPPHVAEPTAPPLYSPAGEASGWASPPGLEQYPQIPPPTYLQATASLAAAGGKAAPYDVTEDSWQPASEGEPNFTPSYVSYNRRAAPLPPQLASPLLAQSAEPLPSKSATSLPSQSADPLPSTSTAPLPSQSTDPVPTQPTDPPHEKAPIS